MGMSMLMGRVAVSLLAASAMFSGQPVELAKETPPEPAWPKGCQLASDLRGTFRDNPRIGSNPDVVVSIGHAVDGPPPADVPPGPASVHRTAADVIEGYRAVYVAADGSTIMVDALRFVDEKLTAAAIMRVLSGETPRIFIGPIAVHVTMRSPRSAQRTTGSNVSPGQALARRF